MFDPTFVHPETLPGEPVRVWSAVGTARVLVVRFAHFLLTTALCAPFWPPYLLMRLVWRRPPVVVAASRVGHVLRAIVVDRPEHGPTAAMRVALLLELARRVGLAGFYGFAWYLDELVWGRALARIFITQPLFEISAARSGSTQLARYLEDDPHLRAPSSMQEAFPFLWLWKLGPLLERLAPRDWAERVAHAVLPPEHHERHEVDPRRTDTFEIIWLAAFQLADLTMSIGPRALGEDYTFGWIKPESRALWEDDFLRFLDGIARKVLLVAPPDPEGQPRRLLVKGHFLNVAPHLAARYPDARFLTVLRAPEKRLQSLVNFYRCQPTVPPCPAAPWPWVVEHVLTAEVAYCEEELAWFTAPVGPRRCVVPFDRYLKDLEGTMRTVYRDCLDRELSPHVPKAHAPRVRTNYSVDRSLAQLGVDELALLRRLERYGRWCRGEDIGGESNAS